MLKAAREELKKEQALSGAAGTHFTCFTGIKVQILTRIAAEKREREEAKRAVREYETLLSLLALLVQKHKC